METIVDMKNPANLIFLIVDLSILRAIILQPPFKLIVELIRSPNIAPPIVLKCFFEHNERLLIFEEFAIDFGHDEEELADWMECFIVFAEGNCNCGKIVARLFSTSLQEGTGDKEECFDHNA
jgi:hypothetical protein